MSTRYDVTADGRLDSSHAGLCGALVAARTGAMERIGVRFVASRHDQRGPAVEVGRYHRIGSTLRAWVL